MGGGNQARTKTDILETDKHIYLSPRIERYKRLYKGTDNSVQAMQDYLEWEYGLVAQLNTGGTYGFFVL